MEGRYIKRVGYSTVQKRHGLDNTACRAGFVCITLAMLLPFHTSFPNKSRNPFLRLCIYIACHIKTTFVPQQFKDNIEEDHTVHDFTVRSRNYSAPRKLSFKRSRPQKDKSPAMERFLVEDDQHKRFLATGNVQRIVLGDFSKPCHASAEAEKALADLVKIKKEHNSKAFPGTKPNEQS